MLTVLTSALVLSAPPPPPGPAVAAVTLTIPDATKVTHQVNPLFMGCHSDSGYTHEPRGFYAQLIFGESFEHVPPAAAATTAAPQQLNGSAFPLGGILEFKPAAKANAKLGMRHCDFQLHASAGSIDNDFVFTAKAALNGAAGAISLQSRNFPTKYVSPGVLKLNGGLRLGVLAGDEDDASFMPAKSRAGWTFTSLSKKAAWKGKMIGTATTRSGTCKDGIDVVLTASAADAVWLNVKAPPSPPPPPPPVTYNPWAMSDGSAFSTDTTTAFHGQASLKLAGAGAGAINRGLGREGLSLSGNKAYEGYFFAKSAAAATLTVSLKDYGSGKVLATLDVEHAGGSAWTMLNYSFTTSDGTHCVDGKNDKTVVCGTMGPSSGHICIKCMGEFEISSKKGAVNVDYIYLQPGAWGRFEGLGVLKSGVEDLKSMGITAIRQGGSFTDPADYAWKNWRGPKWDRPSMGWNWGKSLVGGWGPFEFIDMCMAADIYPVFTTSAQSGPSKENPAGCCTPEYMADLIEYTWGDSTTTWGKQRFDDGHPEPYKVQTFELGNEQYNSNYPKQVAAMEARAVKIGKPKFFYYMMPDNAKWLNASQAAEVEAIGIGDHAVSDIHIGAGGGVELAEKLFAEFPGKTFGAVNAETNDAISTVKRMIHEASDLNDWFNSELNSTTGAVSRLHFRTASFCAERSGHFDAFDQGISFFLPNMTWLQPPGYVHKMISDSWHAGAVEITLAPLAMGTGALSQYSASAVLSDDKATLVVRFANSQPTPIAVTYTLPAGFSSVASQLQISGTDLNAQNSPGDPTAISPQSSTLDFASEASVSVPGQSFTVWTLTK